MIIPGDAQKELQNSTFPYHKRIYDKGKNLPH